MISRMPRRHGLRRDVRRERQRSCRGQLELDRRHQPDHVDSRSDHVDDGIVDETLKESFPASSPPSWAAPARIDLPKRDHDATS
jgi:hypothetical protein